MAIKNDVRSTIDEELDALLKKYDEHIKQMEDEAVSLIDNVGDDVYHVRVAQLSEDETVNDQIRAASCVVEQAGIAKGAV